MPVEPTTTHHEVPVAGNTSVLGRFRSFSPIKLLDVALVLTVGAMVFEIEVVIFFHIVFALLAVGAFFWSFRAFLIRTFILIPIAVLSVLFAVYQGHTQSEELLELPLLSAVVVSVYVIAQRRAAAQQQLEQANVQLEERAAALAIANQALREEHDTRVRLQEDVIRSKEQYTHMLVHDLKNPLTGAVGFVDLLNMTPVTEEQTEMIRGARTAVRRTIDLVENLLDIARIQENRLQLRREPTYIDELLSATAHELTPWAIQESKHIDLVVSSALLPIQVDKVLMQRVMTNLCSNAIKHTPPHTHITLGATHEGAHVRLWVHDSGPGISPDYQSQIFKPFSTRTSTNSKQTSTGLGLSFCKLAVEAHGGELTFHSTPDSGTLFSVLIPLDSEQAARNLVTRPPERDVEALPEEKVHARMPLVM